MSCKRPSGSGQTDRLALANNGLSNSVFAVSGSDLYVGGYFNQTVDGTMTNLNYIAKLRIPALPGYSCYFPLVSK